MGSSSSKPQQYDSYPPTIPPIRAGYPHPVQAHGQFGYYIQQVGNDPSQVQAIPGYYYDAAFVAAPQHTAHKRHNSVPVLPAVKAKTSPPPPRQDDQNPPSSPEPDPSSTPTAPADPVTESSPPPAGDPAASPTETLAADQDPSLPPASAAPAAQGARGAPAPPPAVSAETAAPRARGRLPDPPRDVATGNPYVRPRRAQTGDGGRWGFYTAPAASVRYGPQVGSPYDPNGVPMLRPPRPHAELKTRDLKPRGHARGHSGGGSGISGGNGNSGSSKGPFKLFRSLTLPSLSSTKTKEFTTASVSRPYPYATTSKARAPIPPFPPSPIDTPVTVGPPLLVPPNSPLTLESPHKVLYKKKLYPTAAHLFEAQRYMKHRPDLAERIRTAGENPASMKMVSWSFEEDGFSRSDWAVTWRHKLDEVLYLKFIQHPDLRAELIGTGFSPLLDGREIPQPDAEGVNEFGKALVRLRERLRREGGGR